VLTATDQEKALAVLGGAPPEVILADYHLDRGVTGWDVVVALRAHFGQSIPVVLGTADRSDQCRRQLQGLGVPVLNKPVKAGKMRSVLSHLLNDKREHW
jgi:CheY-like chemotaxis protein